MSARPENSHSSRWLVPAALALLVAAGYMVYRSEKSSPAAPGGEETAIVTGSPALASRFSAPSSPAAIRMGDREVTPMDAASREMEQWLSDESLSQEETARRLWKMAADPSQPEDARADALANGLNLTEDSAYPSIVYPLLLQRGIWNNELGEFILNDLGNRHDRIRATALASLLESSTGDFHAAVREQLLFLVEEDEEADDATLLRLASEKAAEPEQEEE